MTKRTTTGALLVIGALVAAACGDGVLPSGPDFEAQFAHRGSHGNTVEVCHKGRTINVNANAVAGHVRGHGDTAGSCGGGGDASIDIFDIFGNPFFIPGSFISVIFTSTNCSSGLGDEVTYQLVNQRGSVVDDEDFEGDGPFTLSSGSISFGDDPFIVQADCDGGANPILFETVSASFP